MFGHIESTSIKILLAILFPLLFFVAAAIVSAFDELIQRVIRYPVRGRSANPWLAAAVDLCLGAGVGLWVAGILPLWRLPIPSPTVTLVTAPLIGGLLAYAYGARCLARGRDSSWLATFWGGAAFALSISWPFWIGAFVRYWSR